MKRLQPCTGLSSAVCRTLRSGRRACVCGRQVRILPGRLNPSRLCWSSTGHRAFSSTPAA